MTEMVPDVGEHEGSIPSFRYRLLVVQEVLTAKRGKPVQALECFSFQRGNQLGCG